MKLLDLSRPLAVLHELGAKFPLLPAPCIAITTIWPERIRLTFHDDFGAFEAWREALDIDPATVSQQLQGDDTTLALKGSAVRHDVTVELVAYGSSPAMLLQAVAA
jgi:hypothetical protein